jgi:hypothetical protein
VNRRSPGARRTRRTVLVASLGAAGLGLASLALGLAVDPSRVWFSYLAAWFYGAGICIGALIFLMAAHVSKASWLVITRRPLEAIVAALPLYLLLFLPIAFGLSHLYPWASPTGGLDPALRHSIEHKRPYLNPPFFVARTLGYFAVLGGIGAVLRAWSRANDDAPRLLLLRRMRAVSGAGLPLVALVLTWASFDWVMSLEPEYSSTIFGLYVFAGAFAAAIALLSLMLWVLRTTGGPGVAATADHMQALGRLLFAMVAFWAYMAFSQLLIFWIADLPEEAGFYRLRTAGTWSIVDCALILGHFVVPFFALLNRHWKRSARYIAIASAWMLAMHFVDVYWLVLPVHDPMGARPHWLDLGALLFVGGLSCAWIVRSHSSAAPLPRHSPGASEGLHYEAAL